MELTQEQWTKVLEADLKPLHEEIIIEFRGIIKEIEEKERFTIYELS